MSLAKRMQKKKEEGEEKRPQEVSGQGNAATFSDQRQKDQWAEEV
jgi:hypothetical protein